MRNYPIIYLGILIQLYGISTIKTALENPGWIWIIGGIITAIGIGQYLLKLPRYSLENKKPFNKFLSLVFVLAGSIAGEIFIGMFLYLAYFIIK